MNDAVWLKDEERTVEGFAANWDKISEFSNLKAPQSGSEQSGAILTAMQKVTGTGPGSAAADPPAIIRKGLVLRRGPFSYRPLSCRSS